MRVERITDKQGICLITIFIIGSSILIGTGGKQVTTHGLPVLQVFL